MTAALVVSVLLLSAQTSAAQPAEVRIVRLDGEATQADPVGPVQPNAPSRPTVGIALSGGGARGLAHIGVLKVLHREGIPIDMVAGSSMGSIVGGLYAAGYSPEEIERIALDVDWATIFEDAPKRTSMFLAEKEARSRQLIRVPLERFNIRVPSALSTGQRMSDLLSNLTLRATYLAGGDFDRLPHRYRSVATDLLSGKSVVIREGDLSEAMRASTGIPLFLTPVHRGERRLVDGGILNNIPVSVVREMGADVVLAVNVTSSLRPPDKLDAVWEIADQAITIMMQDARDRQLEDADLVIAPDLAGYSSRDFRLASELIRAGEVAAEGKVSQVRALLQREPSGPGSDTPTLSAMTFEGNHHESDFYLGRLVPLKVGETAPDARIREALRSLYASGYFGDAYAETREDSTGVAVTFHVRENPVLTRIRIVGSSLFEEQELLTVLRSTPGRVLNRAKLGRDIETIARLHVDEGYVLAQVHALPFDSTTGLVTIEVDEGRIGRIRVEGNRHTRDGVILREFPLHEGALFRQQKAQEGISNVYATGLFDRTGLSITKGNPDADVTIRVQEKRFAAGELGVHFDKAYKSEAYLGLLHDNAFGLGMKMSLSARIGEKRQSYGLEERASRLWHTYLTHRVRAYYALEERQVYEDGVSVGAYRDMRASARFCFGQQMYRWGAATAEVRVENGRFEALSGRGHPRGSSRIRSIVLRSILDSLDRFPFPRSGRRHEVYVESAGKVLGGTESYVKLLALLDSFYTIGRKHTFRWRAAWGAADRSLPYGEAFRLGGGGDIYGYSHGEVFGDHSNLYGYAQDAFLGRQLLGGGLEYTLWVPKYFYLSLIWQMGNVWQATDEIRLSELHYGWGVRGAFDTMAGPVSLGYGHTKEGDDALYFSVGYEF